MKYDFVACISKQKTKNKRKFSKRIKFRLIHNKKKSFFSSVLNGFLKLKQLQDCFFSYFPYQASTKKCFFFFPLLPHRFVTNFRPLQQIIFFVFFLFLSPLLSFVLNSLCFCLIFFYYFSLLYLSFPIFLFLFFYTVLFF